MNRALWFVLIAGLVLPACRTTKKVAVSTFRVMDAPANYLRHRIDESEGQSTTTTTTVTSDVANPGYPVTETPPPPQIPPVPQRRAATSNIPATPRTGPAPTRKTSPGPTPRGASQPSQFPVARPVPGRPGYVYSLDPNGGMIDVTGYKSGDKAKDPYSKQIFIVP